MFRRLKRTPEQVEQLCSGGVVDGCGAEKRICHTTQEPTPPPICRVTRFTVERCRRRQNGGNAYTRRPQKHTDSWRCEMTIAVTVGMLLFGLEDRRTKMPCGNSQKNTQTCAKESITVIIGTRLNRAETGIGTQVRRTCHRTEEYRSYRQQ